MTAKELKHLIKETEGAIIWLNRDIDSLMVALAEAKKEHTSAVRDLRKLNRMLAGINKNKKESR